MFYEAATYIYMYCTGGRHSHTRKYRAGIRLFVNWYDLHWPDQGGFLIDMFCIELIKVVLLLLIWFALTWPVTKVVGGDYVGSHWLASFLLHALEQRVETWTNICSKLMPFYHLHGLNIQLFQDKMWHTRGFGAPLMLTVMVYHGSDIVTLWTLTFTAADSLAPIL